MGRPRKTARVASIDRVAFMRTAEVPVPNASQGTRQGTDTKALLAERAITHGETWIVAGEIVQMLQRNYELMGAINSTPYGHNWMLLLSKLIRCLYTPNHVDHWRDLAGYATLVAEHLDGRTASKG